MFFTHRQPTHKIQRNANGATTPQKNRRALLSASAPWRSQRESKRPEQNVPLTFSGALTWRESRPLLTPFAHALPGKNRRVPQHATAMSRESHPQLMPFAPGMPENSTPRRSNRQFWRQTRAIRNHVQTTQNKHHDQILIDNFVDPLPRQLIHEPTGTKTGSKAGANGIDYGCDSRMPLTWQFRGSELELRPPKNSQIPTLRMGHPEIRRQLAHLKVAATQATATAGAFEAGPSLRFGMTTALLERQFPFSIFAFHFRRAGAFGIRAKSCIIRLR